MSKHSQIDPLVSFRNTENESVRGTIVNIQRKSLVLEVYNPYSIVQVSEVLSDLTIRSGQMIAYQGKGVVISMVNTGLTAVVSITLIDEWQELNIPALVVGSVKEKAQVFVQDWIQRFQIRRDYQVLVNEMRAYLSDVARWVEQVDMFDTLPKINGQLRNDIFYELAAPLAQRVEIYMSQLETEASLVESEFAAVHKSYAQSALHPFLLRAPFIFRTFTKPLGYAGDYEMVNQILENPRQGPNTYFQMVNATFLQTPVALAHRNRIDILVNYLNQLAAKAVHAGRVLRVLNIGCGPAVEIQRFIQSHPSPELLSFELIDFSQETLDWTQNKLAEVMQKSGKQANINYVCGSVHKILKRSTKLETITEKFDAIYCAGLFDYLSDKVCANLMAYFAASTYAGGSLLVTNVHSSNPMRFVMEHILEWYLIYRDEKMMEAILPPQAQHRKIYVDKTGVNIFAEMLIP